MLIGTNHAPLGDCLFYNIFGILLKYFEFFLNIIILKILFVKFHMK
jgi:hypothetical protein